MRLKKRILGMGLAMSLMLSGLYVAPEKVRAEVENENTQKVESISRGTVIAAKSSDKKVKMPEKAVDGSRIIYTSGSGLHTISSDNDGEYIYYSVYGAGINGAETNAFKRNIKTGKETGIDLGHSIIVGKDFILSEETGVSVGRPDHHIYKTDKNGKRKELVMGDSPILVGNSIYYIAEKKLKKDFYYVAEPLGIYKMDINGKNKKLVKKGVKGQLGVSGKNIYYSDLSFEYQETASKWYNLKTGKLEKNVIPSYLYDPISKTKVTFNKSEVKAGKYKNGKWEYKTILKHKSAEDYLGIDAVRVCGSKILVQISVNSSGNCKFYIMDLNGKNKKLIHTGYLAG